MSKVCLETKCIQCCRETNMVLTYSDIEKIKKRGFASSFFVEDDAGWLRLKNSNGRCVFHNGNNCIIYDDRPEGCSLYPVVYEKDGNRAILDSECPQRHCFSLSQSTVHKLTVLISTLEREQNQRRQAQQRDGQKKSDL